MSRRPFSVKLMSGYMWPRAMFERDSEVQELEYSCRETSLQALPVGRILFTRLPHCMQAFEILLLLINMSPLFAVHMSLTVLVLHAIHKARATSSTGMVGW